MANLLDGEHREIDIREELYKNSDWESEKELQRIVAQNLDVILEKEITEVSEEVTIPCGVQRRYTKFRIDIEAKDRENNAYLIEVKRPNWNAGTELISGIAQLQMYGLVYEQEYKIIPKLIIVTNRISSYTSAYLDRYAKDVQLIVVQGKRFFRAVGLCKTGDCKCRV